MSHQILCFLYFETIDIYFDHVAFLTMEDYLKTKFNGIVFDEHTIPIEYLDSLIELKNAIIDQAKHLFLLKHQRLPKNFNKRIGLNLAKVSEGSAITELKMPSINTLFSPVESEESDVMTKSRTDIINAINTLKQPVDGIDKILAKDAIIHLKKFGRTLKDNEKIEFYIPDNGEVQASYSKKDFEKGQNIKIDFIKSLSNEGCLIDNVEFLEPLDFELQFERIKNLKDGWFDEEGHSYDRDALNSFFEDIDHYYPENMVNPYIFPTTEGNILFEWSFRRDEVSLEVDLKDRSALWCSINLLDDKEIIKEINLNIKKDWDTLISMLKELSINND